MRDTGFEHKRGDVTVNLANSYGFCWGVERAVQVCVGGAGVGISHH